MLPRPRVSISVALVSLAASLPAACGPALGPSGGATEGGSSTASDGDSGADESGGLSGRGPYRDEWRLEADRPFVHIDPATGAPAISELVIGGELLADNFGNRGDVIVQFDGPDDRILIELRRFTFATSVEGAQQDFDELSLWAFRGPVVRPQDTNPADDCTAGDWLDDCTIRVYFDGLSQLVRSGADVRVTLPSTYRQHITVITEDNVAEAAYLDRGNVCIGNLRGSADVRTASGNVWVDLADDASPAPNCTPEQVQACEAWTSDGAPAPWAPECDCIAASGGEFGQLAIDNREGEASNVTVDLPEGLWAAVHAENQGLLQTAAGEHCEAQVTAPAFDPDPIGNREAWLAAGSVHYPGPPAIYGAGYSVSVTSRECGPVAFTEDPAAFVGYDDPGAQPLDERGNIEICAGCIVQSCDERIP